MGWHAYSMGYATCYVADHPLTDQDVQALARNWSKIDEWKGVVWCERGSNSGRRVQAGGWVCFGDRKLIERLRPLLAP